MRHFPLWFFSSLAILILSSCVWEWEDEDGNEHCVDTAPADCTQTESAISCPININISPSLSKTPVLIEVFRGTVENGTLVFATETSDSFLNLDFPCGSYYSARGTYTNIAPDGYQRKIKSIDGGDASAGSSSNCDDETCYTEPTFSLNLDVDVDPGLLEDYDKKEN